MNRTSRTGRDHRVHPRPVALSLIVMLLALISSCAGMPEAPTGRSAESPRRASEPRGTATPPTDVTAARAEVTPAPPEMSAASPAAGAASPDASFERRAAASAPPAGASPVVASSFPEPAVRLDDSIRAPAALARRSAGEVARTTLPEPSLLTVSRGADERRTVAAVPELEIDSGGAPAAGPRREAAAPAAPGASRAAGPAASGALPSPSQAGAAIARADRGDASRAERRPDGTPQEPGRTATTAPDPTTPRAPAPDPNTPRAPASAPTTPRAPAPAATTPRSPAPAAPTTPRAPAPAATDAAASRPPAPSSAATAAEERAWRERAALVAAGSEVVVILPGQGWLYVGQEYGGGSVRFLGKETREGNDAFTFRFDEPGEVGLWFQQQNAATGGLVNERLSLLAERGVPEAEVVVAEIPRGTSIDDVRSAGLSRPARTVPFNASPSARTLDPSAASDAAAPPDDEAADGGEAVVARARELFDAGDALAAAHLIAEAIRDGAVVIGEVEAAAPGLIGALVDTVKVDGQEALRTLWRAIAETEHAAAGRARMALWSDALERGDVAGLLGGIRRFEESGERGWPELVGGLGRAADDETMFLLAQRLEAPGSDRDLRRAATLYRTIVDERPLSRHWDASRARLEYLDRHYFEVR